MNSKNFLLFILTQGFIFYLLLNEITIYRTLNYRQQIRDLQASCDSSGGAIGPSCGAQVQQLKEDLQREKDRLFSTVQGVDKLIAEFRGVSDRYVQANKMQSFE